MARYGSDKPDTRFGMELHCLNDVFADTGFKIFRSVLDVKGEVDCIVVENACRPLFRKQLDQLRNMRRSMAQRRWPS